MTSNISISKNSGATVLTINNFSNLNVTADTPYDNISDIAGSETSAVIVKSTGATMSISFDYTITTESSTVVTGTGSPVTSATGQFLYLYATLMSTGTSSFSDTYTINIDFGNGDNLNKPGVITKITCNMSSDQPLTFKGSITFLVGTVT